MPGNDNEAKAGTPMTEIIKTPSEESPENTGDAEREAKWTRITARVAFFVGLAGFAVSVLNLYFTQIRRPVLQEIIGPQLRIGYAGQQDLVMYVPVGFANPSGRGGVIFRVRATLQRSGDPNRYEIEWQGFETRDFLTGKIHPVVAEPLTVAAASGAGKNIWFAWASSRNPSPVFEPGKYTLGIEAWSDGSTRPALTETRNFELADDVAKDLLNRRSVSDGKLIEIAFEGMQLQNVVAAGKT